MAALGGGGPQSCFGLRLHSSDASVGLAACVGAAGDFPAAWLLNNGVDIAGLTPVEGFQTPRAWQVCETDGRRTQVWRTPKPDPARLRPHLSSLPPHFRAAKSFHVGVHPQLSYDRAHSTELRAAEQLLSVEPYTTASEPLTQEALRELVSVPDIWSPNFEEAASILGRRDLTPLEMADAFVAAGAKVVCIRCGADGAVVLAGNEAWSVPAFEGAVLVDATGCGNAFSGAFLASWATGEGLLEAACWGCAAASFLLECHGVPETPVTLLRGEAERRVGWLRAKAVRLR